MKLAYLWLVAGAMAALLLALRAVGVSPAEAGSALFQGSLGSGRALSATLREMMPLLMAGLAAFVALRAGLFNIGVEGQLIVGALCAVLVGVNLGGLLGIVAALVAGAVGGMLWALPAGLIRAYRNGHEVITTIMLYHVALRVVGYLVAGPLKKEGASYPTTAEVDASVHIQTFEVGRLSISLSLLLAIGFVVAAWIWLTRTVSGYEFRATGLSPQAAEVAGIPTRKVIVAGMALSGALAGLTGALVVLAHQHSVSNAIFASYGFTALGVALLAGAAPFALIFSAFLFAALDRGALDLQDHAPKGIIGITTGLILIIFAAIRYRRAPARE